MATNTYVALDKVTISGSSTTSVTFSSIPSTYTDLVIVASTRDNRPSSVDDGLSFRFNSDSGSNYSETFIYGTGSTSANVRTTNSTFGNVRYIPGSTATTGDLSTTIIHLMNYSNTTTYKTLLSRSGSASSTVAANVNLWRSTSAINQITFYGGSPTTGYVFTAGSTFSLYGIASTTAQGAKAEGGIVTSDSNYWYHTFNASGTFTPLQSLTCDALIVAGGGAGGASNGGGGGAGGLMYGTSLSLTSSTNYTVTIGAGGNGAVYPTASTNGNNSVFSTYTAIGGGAGGNEGSLINEAGKNGGSGGGGAGYRTGGTGTSAGGTATQGSSSPFTGFGNSGGSGLRDGTQPIYTGGGGGGADTAGGNATDTTCGVGGSGKTYSISGSSVTYAGGGGGAGGTTNPFVGGAGGAGGGGAGGTYTGGGAGTGSGTAGAANLGGGGGGGGNGGDGANGGSGIVIVRYAK